MNYSFCFAPAIIPASDFCNDSHKSFFFLLASMIAGTMMRLNDLRIHSHIEINFENDCRIRLE